MKAVFLAVDNQSNGFEIVPEFMPGLEGAAGQVVGVVVTAIKGNVVHPTVEGEVRVAGLERGEDELQGLGQQWCLPGRDLPGAKGLNEW